jgi:hypothetical protein
MGSLNSVSFSHDKIQLPSETKVRNHWNTIVKHQGWLLKKGGVGVKQWIKRYFILFSTSQGHFLAYYADLLEGPMYSTERLQRNIIDLATVTFILPVPGDREDETVPPFSFDLQTTERDWTLCAESQENLTRWLQLLTRAIDEDVAIIPDETFSFTVKAKRDPTGQCVSSDYSTLLTFSAYAVSLFGPDQRLICQWVYTDFYKWSIATQNNKLALQLSVFLDDTFSLRADFLFRTKDVAMVAAVLEYFIEKFMTTMHIQLELLQEEEGDELSSPLGVGWREGEAEGGDVKAGEDQCERKLPHASPNQWQEQQPGEYARAGVTGEDEEDEEPDLLGFGSDDLGLAASSESLSMFSRSRSLELMGGSFKSTAPPPVSLTPSSLPLTVTQIDQHRLWYANLLTSSSLSPQDGPLYDDGILQISLLLETCGPQGRVTLLYRNTSPTETLFSLALVMAPDVATTNSFRSYCSPLKSHLVPQEQIQQQLMVECLQPAVFNPSVVLSYRSPLGSRKSNLLLPVTLLSFNNPLQLSLNDFQLRWGMLNHPGQEIVQSLPMQRLPPREAMKQAIISVPLPPPLPLTGPLSGVQVPSD